MSKLPIKPYPVRHKVWGKGPDTIIECQDKDNEKNCLYCRVEGEIDSEINYNIGKILTIIDAVLTDTNQLKATKDLIRHAMHERDYFVKYINSVVRDAQIK